MTEARKRLFMLWAVLAVLLFVVGARAQEPGKSRVLGTVAAIQGNGLTVKTDSGATESVTVADAAKILKTAPGQKTLAGAAKIGLAEIGVGDRVLMLVSGNPPAASIVIVNKASDLAAMHAQEQEDWQKRGLGGLVKAVDPAAGTVTITSGSRAIVIHTTPSTVIRRYAPDSVKFSDAQPSTLAAIQPGNQLQARGEKSADGSAVTAEEIVSGSFRNVAGIVQSTNPKAAIFTVKDWTNKKSVTIRCTSDTDMRKLDSQMAEMMAARLKSEKGREEGRQAETGTMGRQGHGVDEGPGARSQNSSGPRGGGLAALLGRSPEIHVSDLHKGDAVMVVATEADPHEATAIRVVAGVEPMLQASAKASQNMLSSAWSLGGGGSGSGDQGGEGSQQ